MAHAGRQSGRTERQRQAVAVLLLDLGFSVDGLVDRDVDQVQRCAAVNAAAVVIVEADVVAGGYFGDGLEGAVVVAARIGGAEIGARQACAVQRIERGAVQEAEAVATADGPADRRAADQAEQQDAGVCLAAGQPAAGAAADQRGRHASRRFEAPDESLRGQVDQRQRAGTEHQRCDQRQHLHRHALAAAGIVTGEFRQQFDQRRGARDHGQDRDADGDEPGTEPRIRVRQQRIPGASERVDQHQCQQQAEAEQGLAEPARQQIAGLVGALARDRAAAGAGRLPGEQQRKTRDQQQVDAGPDMTGKQAEQYQQPGHRRLAPVDQCRYRLAVQAFARGDQPVRPAERQQHEVEHPGQQRRERTPPEQALAAGQGGSHGTIGRQPQDRHLQQQQQRQHAACKQQVHRRPVAQRHGERKQQVTGTVRRQVAAVLAQPAEGVRTEGRIIATDPGGGGRQFRVEHGLDLVGTGHVVARIQPAEEAAEVATARGGRQIIDLAQLAGAGEGLCEAEAEGRAADAAAGECHAEAYGIVRHAGPRAPAFEQHLFAIAQWFRIGEVVGSRSGFAGSFGHGIAPGGDPGRRPSVCAGAARAEAGCLRGSKAPGLPAALNFFSELNPAGCGRSPESLR